MAPCQRGNVQGVQYSVLRTLQSSRYALLAWSKVLAAEGLKLINPTCFFNQIVRNYASAAKS